ncbi:serine/threonine-protein kinase [Actinoplanes couchii]|uniref:Protein kinase domain-containing protein n=1 Tax=Actinoplanes couchii TaxID=403638 RepID=A0ABQ3X7R3_9ACTN|nr:serine/threonine-protein kinase [Actinoplanes couchii]MDR6322382.1 serine/threonine protein kinase [Actinoplanes couchii]GID54539.1 hypothetical protein Aco03nite_029430 [Actinoplanes couchii]
MAAVGEVIAGRYRLARPLAAGGMSRIWLATDETATRVSTTYRESGEIHEETRPAFVVLKHCTVPQGLPPDQHELVRHWSLPEAVAAARVRHPNVIHTHAVLPSWDGPWLVMDHLPARTLHQVVDESGPLPAARAAATGLAVLAGLRAIWSTGILHLDVKPGNLLITADGRTVLTDFGPAVTPAGITTLADAGIILGSPKWIAPERIFDHTSTEASDLWSLGATLYHAVEGRPPFLRATTSQILQSLADPRPTQPRRAGPLTPVLAGLLRRSPADRLSATEVEAHLRDIVTPGRRRRPTGAGAGRSAFRFPRFPRRTPAPDPTPHPATPHSAVPHSAGQPPSVPNSAVPHLAVSPSAIPHLTAQHPAVPQLAAQHPAVPQPAALPPADPHSAASQPTAQHSAAPRPAVLEPLAPPAAASQSAGPQAGIATGGRLAETRAGQPPVTQPGVPLSGTSADRPLAFHPGAPLPDPQLGRPLTTYSGAPLRDQPLAFHPGAPLPDGRAGASADGRGGAGIGGRAGAGADGRRGAGMGGRADAGADGRGGTGADGRHGAVADSRHGVGAGGPAGVGADDWGGGVRFGRAGGLRGGRGKWRTGRRRRIPVILAAIAVAAGLTAVAATAEGMTRSGTTGSPPASTAEPGSISAVPGAAGGFGSGTPVGPAAGSGAGSGSPVPPGSSGAGSSASPGASNPDGSSGSSGLSGSSGSSGLGGAGDVPRLSPGSGPSRQVVPPRTVQEGWPPAPLPEGFTWWADPLGYRVAVPSGWRQGAPLTGGRTFTAKRDQATLAITPLAETPSDVVEMLTDAERESDLDHYKRVRIEALPEPASAIWEYTFQTPDGTGMRAVQRVIGTEGHSYVLEWQATRDDWPTELNRFTVVLATFTPTP